MKDIDDERNARDAASRSQQNWLNRDHKLSVKREPTIKKRSWIRKGFLRSNKGLPLKRLKDKLRSSPH